MSIDVTSSVPGIDETDVQCVSRLLTSCERRERAEIQAILTDFTRNHSQEDVGRAIRVLANGVVLGLPDTVGSATRREILMCLCGQPIVS